MLSKSSLNKGGSYLTEPERELGSQIKMVKKKGMTTTTVWQGPLQPWITEMGSFSGGRHQVLGTPASHFTHKPEAGNAAHKFPPSFFYQSQLQPFSRWGFKKPLILEVDQPYNFQPDALLVHDKVG